MYTHSTHAQNFIRALALPDTFYSPVILSSDEQPDVSLRRLHMPEDMFSHGADQTEVAPIGHQMMMSIFKTKKYSINYANKTALTYVYKFKRSTDWEL